MNSATLKEKKKSVAAGKKFTGNTGQTKKAADVMQSVRELASLRQRELFNTISTVAPKKKDTMTKKSDAIKGNNKIAQLYMKGDQGIKKSKYDTTIRQEKTKSTHAARNPVRKDVSAPRKQPITRPRVGLKPQRKTEKSQDVYSQIANTN